MTSRREAKIVGLSGGLQPKGMDLTQFVRRGIRERRLKVHGDDAAGALAFAALDMDEDGEKRPGDPLGPLLLRLKYASQPSKEAFQRAHLILLRRHGWLARRPSETMFAVAYAAIVEWVHDACPKCRGAKAKTLQPQPCLACGQERIEVANGRSEILGQPTPGCGKCGGSGRIFGKAKASRGMACVACRNSGRVVFAAKRRWQLVSDYLATAQKARGEEVKGIAFDTFQTYWQARYYRFMDALRAADQRLVANVDLTFRRVYSRATEATPIEIEDGPDDRSPTANQGA